MLNNINKTKPRQEGFFYLLVILLIIIITMLWQNQQLLGQKTKNLSWDSEKQRQYANKLKAEGLTQQAITAFEEYLNSGKISASIRSNIYYSLGEMLYQEKAYAQALAYFYKSEIANSQTELQKELGNYIVQCLEHLNRTLDAKYQLESRTLLSGEQKEEKPAQEVVARIGEKQITLGQINKELAQLPASLQNIYAKDKAAKLEFIKQYVCNELLYDKGVRLGLRTDPQIRETAELMTKQLIVQKVLEKEVQDKLTQDSTDIENYYKAHQARYTETAQLKIKHILVDSQEQAQDIEKKLSQGEDFAKIAKEQSLDETTRGNGGEINSWVSEQEFGLSAEYGAEFVEDLFTKKETNKFYIIQSEKGFHIVQITDKKAARVKPLEEIKNQVIQEYSQQKTEQITQDLLTNLLNAEKVVIFEEKFQADNSVNTVTPDPDEDKGNNQKQ